MAESTDFPIQRDNFQPEPAPDQGANDPGNYLSLGFQQAAGALSPNNLSQFYRDQVAPTVDEGIGLGTRGIDKITPSPETRGQIGDFFQNIALRLEAAGAVGAGRTPLWMQMRQQDQHQRQLDQTLEAQRATMHQHLLAQEETKRQNQWEDVAKILGNDKLSPPQQITMLKEMGKQNPQASIASQQVNEKMLAQFHLYKDKLPLTPEEYSRKLRDKEITWHDVSAQINQADEEEKQTSKEKAQRNSVQRLITQFSKDPHSLNDTQLKVLSDFQSSNEERDMKIAKLHQELAKGKQELVRGTADIVSPGVPNMAGQVQHTILDPVSGYKRTELGVNVTRQQTEEVPKITLTDAAKVSALNTGVKDIDSLQKTIVTPDGTINRHTLFTGNIFGGLPFTHGKDISRWVLDMVQTKFRLETGASARPDEEATMMRRFAPKITDPDSTIIEKLDDLKQWHLNTLNVFDPTGIMRGRMGESSVMGAPPQSREEVHGKLSKQHPDWSKSQIYEEMHKRGIR